MEPVAQQVGIAKRRCLAGEHQEHGLEGVFGMVQVTDDLTTDVKNHGPVSGHQGGERDFAAGIAPADETFQELPVAESGDRIPLPERLDLSDGSPRSRTAPCPRAPLRVAGFTLIPSLTTVAMSLILSQVAIFSRLSIGAHRFAVSFEQAVLGLPGRVHEADDTGHVPRGRVPLLEIGQVVAVVIARDDLLMAAVREERRGSRCALPPFQLAMMTSREALPRALERAVDKVIVVDRIVMRVKHVGPDDDPRRGLIDLRIAVHRRDVVGQKLARRQLAVLAGAAPVGDPDLVVRHEERLGMEQIVDPMGLVAQDRSSLGSLRQHMTWKPWVMTG